MKIPVVTRLICSLMGIVILFSGCAKEVVEIPAELTSLAEEFRKTAPSAARIELGKKMHAALPSCIKEGAGNMMIVDRANPTFKLYEKDLFALLGQPDETDPAFFLWNLGDDEQTTWCLLVETYEGYVTAGRLDIASKGKR